MRDSAAKLFHCVVVMGAAMGSGCGSGEIVASDAGADGSGGSSGGASSGGVVFGGDDAQGDACYTSNAFEPTVGCANLGECPGTPEAARWPGDCVHPEDLICGVAASPTGCRCFAGSPRAPADCPDPAQFTCQDWTMPCGCQCIAGAPTSAVQCCPALAPDASAEAGDLADASDGSEAAAAPPPYCPMPWTCHSYDPPTGCECRMIPPAIL